MLFGVVIVDLIGFGIVMPVLPFYAKEFGASATVLGLLLMCHAAAQFVFAPLWGRLSDRIGRRPVLLMTVAGTALSLLALGLATSLPWIFGFDFQDFTKGGQVPKRSPKIGCGPYSARTLFSGFVKLLRELLILQAGRRECYGQL